MSAPVPDLVSLAAMVDELGDLEQELGPHNKSIKRREALRAILRADADVPDVTLAYKVEGSRFTALFGPRSFESVISKYKVSKAIGAKKFRDIVSLTLKALNSVLSTNEQAGMVTKEQIGYRPLDIVAKPEPAETAKAA